MSHADDGTIHAYLDGELSALEVARLEAHLAQCAPCGARVEAERDVVTRSTRLLARAAPPERDAPPLESLRERATSPKRRFRVPLSWAAGLVLTIGVGWFAARELPRSRSGNVGRSEHDAAAPLGARMEAESSRTASAPATALTESARGTATSDLADARVPAGAGAPVPAAPAPPVPAPSATADSYRRLAEAAAPPGERGRADQRSATPASDSIAPPAPSPSADMGLPNAAAEARALNIEPRRAASESIEVDSARTLLAGDVFAVPELPVKAVRREQVGGQATVVVEQALDSTRSIQIVHRRSDSETGYSARRATQRRVGSTDVEVRGPLPTDSLVRLLDRLRAIR